MLRLCTLALAFLPLIAADDPWTPVRQLRTGAELRVYEKGKTQPLQAAFADLTDESLLILVKDEQKAIPRDSILRIDARPARTGSRVTKETRTTRETQPDTSRPLGPTAPGSRNAPSDQPSTSSSVSVQGKPDFETIYRRPLGAPKPPQP